jgi:hypothetical protein
VTLVTEVPAAEAMAAQQPRVAMRAIKQRSKNQEYKAARRRAEGRPLREEWLAAHSTARTKPWLAAGIDRATWFRRRAATGAAGALNTAPRVGKQAE